MLYGVLCDLCLHQAWPPMCGVRLSDPSNSLKPLRPSFPCFSSSKITCSAGLAARVCTSIPFCLQTITAYGTPWLPAHASTGSSMPASLQTAPTRAAARRCTSADAPTRLANSPFLGRQCARCAAQAPRRCTGRRALGGCAHPRADPMHSGTGAPGARVRVSNGLQVLGTCARSLSHCVELVDAHRIAGLIGPCESRVGCGTGMWSYSC